MILDRHRLSPFRHILPVLTTVVICGFAARGSAKGDTKGSEIKRTFKNGDVHLIDPGDPKSADLPPPNVKILKPTKVAKLRFGEPLKVLVELTLPIHGKLPTWVMVGVKERDNTFLGTRTAIPKEFRDGVYTYECEMKGLHGRSGEYQVEVESIYVYTTKEDDGTIKPGRITRFYQRLERHFDGDQ